MSAVKLAPLTADRRRRHQTMAEAAVAELREAIYSGELAAGTPLRLEELARSLGMSISPVREARRAHTDFHFSLYDAAGSDWLVRVIRPAWENAERYRAASLAKRGTLGQRQREHARILDACARHDADIAAAELYRHLAVTANLVARQMGAADLFPVPEPLA